MLLPTIVWNVKQVWWSNPRIQKLSSPENESLTSWVVWTSGSEDITDTSYTAMALIYFCEFTLVFQILIDAWYDTFFEQTIFSSCITEWLTYVLLMWVLQGGLHFKNTSYCWLFWFCGMKSGQLVACYTLLPPVFHVFHVIYVNQLIVLISRI